MFGVWLGLHNSTGPPATQQWSLLSQLSLFGNTGCGSSSSWLICTVYAVQTASLRCNRSFSNTRTCPSYFTPTSATDMDLYRLPRLTSIRLVPLAPGPRTCSTRTPQLRIIPVGSLTTPWDRRLLVSNPRVPHHDSRQALMGAAFAAYSFHGLPLDLAPWLRPCSMMVATSAVACSLTCTAVSWSLYARQATICCNAGIDSRLLAYLGTMSGTANSIH
jgi:hypothetical protein